jgi:predicted heme/steroid binding protein
MSDEDPEYYPPAKKHTTLVLSIAVAVALVGGALFLRAAMAASDDSERTFTAAQLAEFNGASGKQCFVAVDGKVYEIEQGRLWNNGKHESSDGRAECGKDLSQAITKSPHGKSKLSTLKVVGTYTGK